MASVGEVVACPIVVLMLPKPAMTWVMCDDRLLRTASWRAG
jgi:hypothetical protein